jgi:hypothetical protein
MSQEQRREKRLEVSMAVTLILRDKKNMLVLAAPVSGKLVDISRRGARRSIPQIRVGSHHLFYACSDDSAKIIHLEVVDREKGEKLVIPAHPVWFNHILSGAAKHFELGLEFLIPPKDPRIVRLHAFLFGRPPREGGWLKRLFRLS